ncbi:Replication factor A protein 1 [Lithohypha guttulata]|uniref:Replication protein A subunit n=1 Tax=Lithohypha guttulata TaxID=1690604 RepID=A0AAN7SY68_9EURO|nr:Replication factor A protein 1 [Lithohypha guttulata]
MDASEVQAAIDKGSLQAIFQDSPGRVQQPVVQCVQIKPMSQSNGEATERYRVVFSDTQNYVQTMLATSINDEIHQDRLKKGAVVQLVSYQANLVKGKRILIVTGIHVLQQYGVHPTLGSPVVMEIKDEGATNTISSNGFYGNQPQQQQAQQQQTRAMPSHSKPPSSSAHANIYPIEALSPYSHKWTIKARCTSKSDIKTWHNRNGEGKLFSVNLLDESGEIRATGFNDQCDQLYELFQEGSAYYISSPCRVQMAKKQFSNVNNDYELTFERDTIVEKAEQQDDVPQIRFNFTTISDLESIDKDTTIDVIGILKDVGEVNQITSKTTSKPYDKRELTLVDDSGYSVRLTVWGKVASSFEVAPETVVAFKGVKVSDFGGRSLSLLSSGSMATNPDLPESHRLRGWYDHAGQGQNFSTHANVQGTVMAGERRNEQVKSISAVKEEQLGMTEQQDFFNLKASIQYIKQDNFCYPACREEKCNKKLVELGDGWRCERCDKTFDAPEYRYIMSVNVSDHSGQIWLSCFDEVGRNLMGMTANELMAIKEEGDDKRVSDIFSDANCTTWNWRCVAKMETFQDNTRVRYQVRSSSGIDFVSEGQKMIALIKQYDNIAM